VFCDRDSRHFRRKVRASTSALSWRRSGYAHLTVGGLGLRIRMLERSLLLRATKNDRVRSASDLIGVESAKL